MGGGGKTPCGMRAIDMANMEVVYSGVQWMHDIPPCSKHAIQLLEKNTKVVTWIMPKGGGVREQIPCIVYKDKHYSLSLRMQKAIYRHIRLKKGFQNEVWVIFLKCMGAQLTKRTGNYGRDG